MTKKHVLAQDVKVGDKIMIDAYASIEVANIIETKLPDGSRGYAYWSPRGYRVWNREGEGVLKLN